MIRGDCERGDAYVPRSAALSAWTTTILYSNHIMGMMRSHPLSSPHPAYFSHPLPAVQSTVYGCRERVLTVGKDSVSENSRPYRSSITTYRDLDVWNAAMALTVAVYRFSDLLPREELYGMVSQMRRAAVSVPSNIAEGYARRRRGIYLNHLAIAHGSLAELETQLLLALHPGFCTRADALPLWQLMQRVGKMLHRLTNALEPK